MKKYIKEFEKEIDVFISMKEVIQKIDAFCSSWHLNWRRDYQNYLYKFNKSKIEKIIKSWFFIRMMIGSTYGIDENDLEEIKNIYLRETKQKENKKI